MARAGGKKPASDAPQAAATPPPAPEPEALDTVSLAERILARTIRPRTADIRRLAEAVLAVARKPAKKKTKKSKKKAAKKAERKLSKIPGQKAAN
jgi:hypothetical protein